MLIGRVQLTNKAHDILSQIADSHRQDFLERNSNCNENDIERDFLHTILLKFCSHKEVLAARIANEIESIR